MNDFERDPELDGIRELWKPPAAPERLEEEMLRAFRGVVRGAGPRRRYWLFAAAAIVIAAIGMTGGVLLDRAIRPAPKSPPALQMIKSDGNNFVPVKQPRLIVISRGEQP